MLKIDLCLPLSDPLLAGNWHPFPPPEEGFYDLRRIVRTPSGSMQAQFLRSRRVYSRNGRLMIIGRRLSRLRPEEGWQFRFMPGVQHRPRAVLYYMVSGVPVRRAVRDLTDQLPVANSVEEARYIVRSFNKRWPAFVHQHVEYVPEEKSDGPRVL